MLLPAVFGIHRAERRVDPTRREGGVSVVAAALADAERLDAALGELDRRAHAGCAGADHEHTGRERSSLVDAPSPAVPPDGETEGERQGGEGEGGEERDQLAVRPSRGRVARRGRPRDRLRRARTGDARERELLRVEPRRRVSLGAELRAEALDHRRRAADEHVRGTQIVVLRRESRSREEAVARRG